MARCRHNYIHGSRTSLAKEVEGQVSIVACLPDVSAQSRAFLSGRSKVHGMVTIYIYIYIHIYIYIYIYIYIHTNRGGEVTVGKSRGGKTGGCGGCLYKTCRVWG